MNKLECVLLDFRGFLEQHKLAQEKHIPFLVSWVRQFLVFAKRHRGKSFDHVSRLFAEQLSVRERIDDWQIRQALDAIRIYGYQFSNLSESDCAKSANGEGLDRLIECMRSVCRLRHYSKSTEKTYILWIKKFYTYCQQTRCNDNIEHSDSNETPESSTCTDIDNHGSSITFKQDDVKAFITHLALNRNVSASTQNQAFYALLLLYREVLHIDLSEMEKNVRAKRDRKLPVVLSIDETKRLLAAVDPRARLMVELLYGAGLRLSELLRGAHTKIISVFSRQLSHFGFVAPP